MGELTIELPGCTIVTDGQERHAIAGGWPLCLHNATVVISPIRIRDIDRLAVNESFVEAVCERVRRVDRGGVNGMYSGNQSA